MIIEEPNIEIDFDNDIVYSEIEDDSSSEIEPEEIDEDLDEFDSIIEENEIEDTICNLVVNNDKILSLNRLTKYERCALLSCRAHHLSIGAHTSLEKNKFKTPLEIAKKELELGILPLKIKRILPNLEIEFIS